MKNLPILLILLLQLILGEGQTLLYASSSCRQQDLSHQLGPVRDQEEDGICHVAVSSTLVTQLLNATGQKKDFLPSWLDAMNCADDKQQLFQLPNQGGVPRQSLKCILGKGVCAEEKAPYDQRVYLSCTPKNQHRCAPAELLETCRRPEKDLKKIDQSKMCQQQNALPLVQQEKNLVDQLDQWQKVQGHYLCQENDSLMETSMACLKNHLITDDCRAQRVKLPAEKYSPQEINLGNKNSEEKRELICKVLNGGRAIGISLCLNQVKIPAVQKMLGQFKVESDGCQGAHGVVIAGSKFMEGKLHFYIRNSWGEDSPFEGWVAADVMDEAFFAATFIGEKN